MKGAGEVSEEKKRKVKPGVCIPWEERVKEYKRIGDENLVKNVWEELEKLAYSYIWFWFMA